MIGFYPGRLLGIGYRGDGMKKNKNLILIVGFLFLTPLLIAQNVCLLIDTRVGDITIGNTDYSENTIIKTLSKQFPESSFFTIRANTSDEISKNLNAYSQDQIDCLYVMAHGNQDLIGSNIHDFQVKLLDNKAIKETFGPVIGHFSKNARIIFDGCEILTGGTLEDKKSRMEKVAKNFDLTNGSLYLNETDGNSSTELIRQPFWEQSDPLMKTCVGMWQGLAPLAYPIIYIKDYFSLNRGHLAEIKDGKLVEMQEDRMKRATKKK